MKRLTIRYNGEKVPFCPPFIKCATRCEECEHMDKMMHKLANYEDAEEQGLLLRLPVAIGSTLYQKRKDYMIEFKTIGIIYDITSKEWLYEVAMQSGVDWIKTVCSMECVGKTVFLTKEEAEQALADMKGDSNG